MQQVSGDVRIGETASASWAISRIYGVGLLVSAAYVALLIAATTILSSLLDGLPPALSGALQLPMLVLVVVGGAMGLIRYRQWSIGRALKARGKTLVTPVTFTADDLGLGMDSPEAQMRLAWSAVTDLLRTKAHWVFVVGGMGYCLPRRFFASIEDERAFIRSAMARLSEGARERSGKAAAFVAWE